MSTCVRRVSSGIEVVRVPAYSPHAVAEFTVGLILSLNRRIHRAYVRTRDNNFALDGLLGFDLHGRTVGVIGTGAIGAIVARIMRQGFACEVLAYDLQERPELVEMGVRYTEPRELAAASDIITLHCPLTPQTRHIVNRETLTRTRRGFMLVNTSRGAPGRRRGADRRAEVGPDRGRRASTSTSRRPTSSSRTSRAR